MKIITLFLTIFSFLSSWGESSDPARVALMSRAACLEKYADIAPGTYVCKKEKAHERKYILSEPGVSNEAHLCEIDLRLGRNQESADWNAKNDFCFCRRTLFELLDELINEEGYSCYKEVEQEAEADVTEKPTEPETSSEPVEEPPNKITLPIGINDHQSITFDNADDEGYKVWIGFYTFRHRCKC